MSIIDQLNSRSIYDYMIIFLVTLNIVSNVYLNVFSFSNPTSFFQSWIRLIAVPAFAALLDLGIKYFVLKKPIALPKTALISGLFVAGILDPTAPIYVHFIAAFFAILSKHTLKFASRNIFNPAGFGITLTGLIFTYLLKTPIVGSWWIGATLLVIPFGLYISYRIQKLPMTFAFFIIYPILAIFTLKLSITQVLDPSFLSGYFFFSAFMLVEPKTTPYTFKAMILAGLIVAILSAVSPVFLPTTEFTLISLMLMNLFKDVLDEKLPDE